MVWEAENDNELKHLNIVAQNKINWHKYYTEIQYHVLSGYFFLYSSYMYIKKALNTRTAISTLKKDKAMNFAARHKNTHLTGSRTSFLQIAGHFLFIYEM